jgi:serine/threonine-protein kinase
MVYDVPQADAERDYPEYKFLQRLTPSAQKAAFQVRDAAGKHFCLKLISPTCNLDRVNREIVVLQSIDHPNVVRMVAYENVTRSGMQRHCIVEEFVNGADLESKLIAGTKWARSGAAKFFASLLDGLEALRKINVVHRDLKPNNIRVRPDDSPVIIDFGLARLLDLSSLTATSVGAAVGTLLYFSPEQFAGSRTDIDHRTDLFAVGVLLYQALLGRHPFFDPHVTKTHAQLRDNICNSQECFEAADFRALPKEWQTLLRQLMGKQRINRPSQAGQVAAILRRIGGI